MPAEPPAPPGDPHRRPSGAHPPIYRRRWFPVALGLFALILVGGIITSDTPSPSDFGGDPAGQRVAAAPATTTTRVTTTTARATTTTEPPTTTRRPPCPKPKTVLTMSDSGMGQSKDFKVKDDYEVRWSFTPEGDDVGVFGVWLETEDGEPLAEIANTRLKDSGTWEGNGSPEDLQRLAINAYGRWTIKVVDVPEGVDLDACGAND